MGYSSKIWENNSSVVPSKCCKIYGGYCLFSDEASGVDVFDRTVFGRCESGEPDRSSVYGEELRGLRKSVKNEEREERSCEE